MFSAILNESSTTELDHLMELSFDEESPVRKAAVQTLGNQTLSEREINRLMELSFKQDISV